MKKAVVLLSGGMDSATLLHQVANRAQPVAIHALSFRYGQKHARELQMARWQARAAQVAVHHCVDISRIGSLFGKGSALTDPQVRVPDLAAIPTRRRAQPPTYVPNRNLIFLAMAAGYAEANDISDIFYAAQAQDTYGYWDCTPQFVRRLNHTLALNRNTTVRVHAPFAAMPKHQVLTIGVRLGVDFAHTWTCYRGQHPPCTRCPSCIERAQAFQAAALPDPLLSNPRRRPAAPRTTHTETTFVKKTQQRRPAACQIQS